MTTEELADRLARLDDEPVAAHPDVLEQVHRAIVIELEALATSRVLSAVSSAVSDSRPPHIG